MADYRGVDVDNGTTQLVCGPTRGRVRHGASVRERLETIGWDVDASTGCWEWRGERGKHGRARLTVGGGKRKYPYRITYELTYGPIPDGLVACHTCDNPGCVNPDHITPGTQADNISMIPPERRNSPALGPAEQSVVRRLYATGLISQPKLARVFGVSVMTINRYVRRAAADRSE